MSDKRPHVKDGCHGKYRYLHMAEAQMEIDRAKDLRDETLRAYECDSCHKFHLTSKVKHTASGR